MLPSQARPVGPDRAQEPSAVTGFSMKVKTVVFAPTPSVIVRTCGGGKERRAAQGTGGVLDVAQNIFEKRRGAGIAAFVFVERNRADKALSGVAGFFRRKAGAEVVFDFALEVVAELGIEVELALAAMAEEAHGRYLSTIYGSAVDCRWSRGRLNAGAFDEKRGYDRARDGPEDGDGRVAPIGGTFAGDGEEGMRDARAKVARGVDGVAGGSAERKANAPDDIADEQRAEAGSDAAGRQSF